MKKCEYCGGEFEAGIKRESRFCKDACRVGWHRRRKKAMLEQPVVPDGEKEVVVGEKAAEVEPEAVYGDVAPNVVGGDEDDPLPIGAVEAVEDPDAREGIFKPYIDPCQGWAYLTFPETKAARAVPRAVIDMNQLDAYCGNAVAPRVLPKAKVKRVAPVIEERGFPYWAYIKAIACPAGWRMGTG